MDTTRLHAEIMGELRWARRDTKVGSPREPVLRSGQIVKKVKILRRRQVENATTSHFERFQNDQFAR